MSRELNDYEVNRLRELLSGGDTFAHWHSEDRVPTQAFLHGLQQLSSVKFVEGDAVLGKTDDIVFVDTSMSDVTVTLPYSSQGREYTVVKIGAANTLIIDTVTPLTVNGSTSVRYTSPMTSRTFKLCDSDWKHLTGAVWDKLPHGAFSNTGTLTTTANTATRITFNSTEYSRQVTQVAGNGIHVHQSGLYNIQFSCQLTNNDTQTHDAALWLRRGAGVGAATDLANTASVVSVVGTHGGVKGHQIIAANFMMYLEVDDYIELWWAPSSAQVSLESLPAQTLPYPRPVSPSVVVTLSYISSETSNG